MAETFWHSCFLNLLTKFVVCNSYCLIDNHQQARKPWSYLVSKLHPVTRWLTGVKCRATSLQWPPKQEVKVCIKSNSGVINAQNKWIFHHFLEMLARTLGLHFSILALLANFWLQKEYWTSETNEIASLIYTLRNSHFTGCIFSLVPPRKVLRMELVPPNRDKWLS